MVGRQLLLDVYRLCMKHEEQLKGVQELDRKVDELQTFKNHTDLLLVERQSERLEEETKKTFST